MCSRPRLQDLAAEQAVLGAIFLDSERLIEVSEYVTADDFYKTSHKIIFSYHVCACKMIVAIDVLTVHSLWKIRAIWKQSVVFLISLNWQRARQRLPMLFSMPKLWLKNPYFVS